jgi:hypothetical protein
MNWDTLESIIAIAANSATAAALWFLVRQARIENRARAKEASQAVWDFLAAEDVYMARIYLEHTDPPADFEAEMKDGSSEWLRAALKCYLAYQKAAILVMRHKWMEPEVFASQWGYSTLVVWARLKTWIEWYGRTRSYPGFGDSIEQLVALIEGFDEDRILRFRKDRVGVPVVQEDIVHAPGADCLHLPFTSVVPSTGGLPPMQEQESGAEMRR